MQRHANWILTMYVPCDITMACYFSPRATTGMPFPTLAIEPYKTQTQLR